MRYSTKTPVWYVLLIILLPDLWAWNALNSKRNYMYTLCFRASTQYAHLSWGPSPPSFWVLARKQSVQFLLELSVLRKYFWSTLNMLLKLADLYNVQNFCLSLNLDWHISMQWGRENQSVSSWKWWMFRLKITGLNLKIGHPWKQV